MAAIGGTDANLGAARPQRDNVLLVHWHDLGRYLGVYGHPDVSSPRLDQLAAPDRVVHRMKVSSAVGVCAPE